MKRAERMSEAEEIDRLIEGYVRMCVGWPSQYSSEAMGFARQNIIDRIKSIITERDQLRKAAQSHRGKQ